MMEHQSRVDDKLKKKLPELRQTVEDICQLAADTPGLEQCVPAMQDALNQDSASPAEAALALLLALECLPFDAKIGFFEKMYGKVAESWAGCDTEASGEWKGCHANNAENSGKGFGKGKWKGFG